MSLTVDSRFRILKVIPEMDLDQTGKGQQLVFMIDDPDKTSSPQYICGVQGEVYWAPSERFSIPESDAQVESLFRKCCEDFRDIVYEEIHPHDEEPPEMQYE